VGRIPRAVDTRLAVGRPARAGGASHAIDRQAINEAESLGYSAPTGNIVPRHQEFALAIDPLPYDPSGRGAPAEAATRTASRRVADAVSAVHRDGRSDRQLLRRRRDQDAPPHDGARVAALGVADKKMRGVFVGATGRRATRPLGSKPSRRARRPDLRTIPEVEALFAKQIQEMDRKKREEMLHQIQRILADRVPTRRSGERLHPCLRAAVEEAGLALIQSSPTRSAGRREAQEAVVRRIPLRARAGEAGLPGRTS